MVSLWRADRKILFGFVVLVAAGTAINAQKQWKTALESPYGNDLLKCRADWTSLSKRASAKEIASCLHKLLLSVVPRLREPAGVSELQVPPIDPLAVTETVLIGGSGVFRGQLTDMRIRGIANGLTPENAKVEYDVARKEARLTVKIPVNLEATAKYKMEINAGALFGQTEGGSISEGKLKGIVENVTAVLTTKMTNGRNGDLRLVSSKSTFAASNLGLVFTSNDPSDTQPGFLNSVLKPSESNLQVLEEIKPYVNKILSRSLGSIYHGGFKALERI